MAPDTTQGVFIGREGVIIRPLMRGGRPCLPSSLEELEILPGAVGALERLRRAGCRIIMVTHDPEGANGAQGRDLIVAINERLHHLCPIDDIKVCNHRDEGSCRCWTPTPELLLGAAAAWSLNLRASFMVGSHWWEIAAGQAAGCTTILVGGGFGKPLDEAPHAVVGSLYEASLLIFPDQTMIA